MSRDITETRMALIMTAAIFVEIFGLLPESGFAQWAPCATDTCLATGNAGIGTSTPTQKLDVVGNIQSSGFLRANSANGLVLGELANVRRLKSNGTDFWFMSDTNGSGTLGVTSPLLDLRSNATTITGTASIATTGGSLNIGTLSGPLKINVGGRQLIGFNQGGGAVLSGDIVGGMGFWGTGVSHGQFHYRAGVGFEFLNVSADAPSVTHASIAYAPILTGNLTVTGNVVASGNIAAKYQDVAEWVPASHSFPAGTVLVLDTERPNHVRASSFAYDTRVAGVVSEQPGVILGEASEGKIKVATTGRVKVHVDASSGPVHIGDLLVTGEKAGIAMVSQPMELNGRKFHQPGTILGKALESLDTGEGEILVLLSMQ